MGHSLLNGLEAIHGKQKCCVKREEKVMSKKSEYKIEREAFEKKNEKAMKGMTDEQIETIKNLKSVLGSALCMLAECNDLYLSDVAKLDENFHKLCKNFNLPHDYR